MYLLFSSNYSIRGLDIRHMLGRSLEKTRPALGEDSACLLRTSGVFCDCTVVFTYVFHLGQDRSNFRTEASGSMMHGNA